MIISLIPVQIRRNIVRSFLVVSVSFCLLILIGVYWQNILQTEESLESLSDSIPIKAQITDISGSRQTALEIAPSTLDRILMTGNVDNLICTAQAAGNIEKINQKENPKQFDTVIVGTNTIDAFSSLTMDDIHFYKEKEQLFLNSEKPLCIVRDTYAMKHGIREGDKISIPIYSAEYVQRTGSYQYYKVGLAELTVMGEVAEQNLGDTSASLIVPIQWLRKYIEDRGNHFYYSSLIFQIKNPMKLNDFKKQMEQIGLTEINTDVPETVHGGSLTINDTIFIDNAEKLLNNLKLFERCWIPFLILIGILIVAVIFLIMRSRRLEIAISTSLGQKQNQVMLQLFCEVGTLILVGSMLGTFMLKLFTNIPESNLFELLGAFVLVGGVGIAIALRILLCFDIMTMLTKAE